MAWLNDLSALFGVPAGGAVAAVAVYSAAVSAEKEATETALRDIAQVIRDKIWSNGLALGRQVKKLFIYTFGEPHFSLKCLRRSIYASLLFIICFGLQYSFKTHNWPWPISAWFVATSLLTALVTDYISLLKTRVILLACSVGTIPTGIALIIDFFVSLLFAYVSIMFINLIVDLYTFGYEPMNLNLFLTR
jgi:hypothetical protein